MVWYSSWLGAVTNESTEVCIDLLGSARRRPSLSLAVGGGASSPRERPPPSRRCFGGLTAIQSCPTPGPSPYIHGPTAGDASLDSALERLRRSSRSRSHLSCAVLSTSPTAFLRPAPSNNSVCDVAAIDSGLDTAAPSGRHNKIYNHYFSTLINL